MLQSYKLKLITSFLVYSVLFINKSVAKCTAKENGEYECEVLSDIQDSDPKNDWKNVKVFTSTKQQVTENSFNNIPNVETLTFNGAINKMNRNSFKKLHKLKQLNFFNNDIVTLESLVFENLSVEEMIIYTSNIRTLKVRCFDNVPNLKRIYIHQNSISTIPVGVFSYTNIEFLFLNVNKIKTIEPEAFYGMEKLIKLALEANFLKTFDAPLLVGNTSPNLELLWLARNQLTKLNKDVVSPFPKMKLLLIHLNNIDSIEDGTFDGLNNLRYIDISNNKLQEFSPRIFPREGLEFMDILFLQNNRLIYLSTDVIDKLPRLKKVAIGGNPWLCPCYHNLKRFLQEKEVTLLCDDEEYLEGKRPICVSPELVTDKCEPSKEKADSLFQVYFNAQSEYEKLPPLCKIYCDNNKSCYSHAFDVLNY